VSMSNAMKLRLTSVGGYHGFKGLKEEAKRRRERESRKACSPMRRAVKWVRTGRGGADRCDSNLHSDVGGGSGQQQAHREPLRLVCEERRQGARKTRTRMRGLSHGARGRTARALRRRSYCYEYIREWIFIDHA
ncbi:hypothetical protein ALC62_05982, partial [Cyphomyrmex costatus]